MAKKVQKKTQKKVVSKKVASNKTKTPKTVSKTTVPRKKTKVKKMIDEALTQFSPELKAKVSHLKKKLNSKKMQNVADLRKLALAVLEKAENVVSSMRSEKNLSQKNKKGDRAK